MEDKRKYHRHAEAVRVQAVVWRNRAKLTVEWSEYEMVLVASRDHANGKAFGLRRKPALELPGSNFRDDP